MNLHGLANGAIRAVNPNTMGTARISDGYTTASDGKQTPKYQAAKNVDLQIQPNSTGELRQLDGLNIQGRRIKMYVFGRLDGIVRPALKGGDLITVPSGVYKGVWLVVQNDEQWPDWCAVSTVLQLDGVQQT